MVARPFQVLGVQQIAVGGRDRSALRELWVDRLGLFPVEHAAGRTRTREAG